MSKSKNAEKTAWYEEHMNVYEAMGYPPEEAERLFLRSVLALQFCEIIKKKGWSQRQAAEHIGIPQPRIAEIMKGKLEKYSVDQLVKYLHKAGTRVIVSFEKATVAS